MVPLNAVVLCNAHCWPAAWLGVVIRSRVFLIEYLEKPLKVPQFGIYGMMELISCRCRLLTQQVCFVFGGS